MRQKHELRSTMVYRNLRQCVADLEQAGHLVRLADPISATLEAAEIQRRVYLRGGPAVLFENVSGCRFPMVSNLFGTLERARFMFRHTLPHVRRLIALKVDPNEFWRQPFRALRALPTAAHMRPRRRSDGPVLAQPLDDRSAAATQIVAGRRRCVHHAAAGLLGRPRAAWACGSPTWACTACSCPVGNTPRTAKWGCTISCIAALAFTMPRPCGKACRCVSTSSWAARRR